MTIKTASTVSQAAKNAIYGISGPTKSPSTGLHKPTWKPTPGSPTGKPLEHRQLSEASGKSHPGDVTSSQGGKGVFAAEGPSKSPSTGIHKPTWKPTAGKPSGKPVEPWKEGVESAHTEKQNSAHQDGEEDKGHRQLAGSPTKSPSSGLHKPTWKPSSKPNEHRELAGSPTKSPSSGLHKPTWKPSSKPNEHRNLAGSPTKSPSSGLHKPTWKPSSKPAEH